jgi:hypothetical protein
MKKHTKTITINDLQDIYNIRKELGEQGWQDSKFEGCTEKLLVYAWRWHGSWSGYQKGYMNTFYR